MAPTSANHTVRCSDAVWEAARRRASHEGVTISKVITEILEGYASGKLNLPTVIKKY